MIERWRLPRLQIATKLYGAIALILAVVYVLAGAATHFASRSLGAAGEVRGRSGQHVDHGQDEGDGAVKLGGDLQTGKAPALDHGRPRPASAVRKPPGGAAAATRARCATAPEA